MSTREPPLSNGITRELLEVDGVRRGMRERHPEVPLLSEATLQRSLQACLADRPPGSSGIWLFAYGSLLWNPCVHVAERQEARLYGYHRDFRLRLTYGRGTPERPGLMLGLVPGGSCRGMALRIPEPGLEHELTLVWRRELLTGVYVPRWLTLSTPAGPLPAITFVVDRGHPCYCGRLSEDDEVQLLATGEGMLGSAADYLESTVAHLDEAGIHDRRLHHLRARVRREGGRRR